MGSRALQHVPKDPQTLLLRAGALVKERRLEEALAGYIRVLHLQPDCTEAKQGMENCRQETGANSEEEEMLKMAIKMSLAQDDNEDGSEDERLQEAINLSL